jgi:hypothetical protein
VDYKYRSDTGNNSGDWNHLEIRQTVPEQNTGERAKLRSCRKQPYWALHTAGSADVKIQNIFNMGNNITCSTDCKYRTATTPYIYVP